jgi:hypothetical protein
MTSNNHIYIKNKGAFMLMTPVELAWLSKVQFSITSIPAVLFSQNGSGADPVNGFMNADTIIRNLKNSLISSVN